MYTSKDVLETARVIRLYLPDLLGAEAETVDRALAELLTRAESGEAVDNPILELLAERDPTREWTSQCLNDKIPPPVMRSYDSLAGSVSVIDANAFVCEVPGCSRIWYRPKVGIEPPLCQEHHILLVPAQSQAT
ncbi:hypothetical protein [Leptothoe sp. PORK10 BA2]|uniref:hypothetical protein n=1 Tax=Leptothoe sp. PORK10 BA2 TaxID=3110254 RepID=UPI002B20C603|nr:hypothetical protein [Leptothoe sp. PORK10 BA2]MEA5467119.1 hypothetical protein [Leptothoe sp. PORK10 BA2]